jgi:hypothetical protein
MAFSPNVMAGLVPAIRAPAIRAPAVRAKMVGTSPAMTVRTVSGQQIIFHPTLFLMRLGLGPATRD